MLSTLYLGKELTHTYCPETKGVMLSTLHHLLEFQKRRYKILLLIICKFTRFYYYHPPMSLLFRLIING